MPRKPQKYFGTTGLFAQPVGKGLMQHHNTHLQKSALELIRLGTHWPDIVGKEASQYSRPFKLQYTRGNAVLHIQTQPAYALELQHLQPVLLQRVCEILGHRKVQRIKLIHA